MTNLPLAFGIHDPKRDPNDDPLKIDRSNYIDPGDMFNFEYGQILRQREEELKNILTQPSKCDSSIEDKDAEELNRTKEQLLECQDELKSLKEALDNKEDYPRLQAFFGRLVKVILKKHSIIKGRLDGNNDPVLQFVITPKFLDSLEKLSDIYETRKSSSKCVEDVLGILEMLLNKSYVDERESFWIRHFDTIVGIFLAVAAIVACHVVLIQRRVFPVIFLVFIISCIWEWKRLYEEEVRQRQQRVIQGPPEGCSSAWYTLFLRGFQSLFIAHADGGDPCTSYYSTFGESILLNVNPASAIANVISLIVGGFFSSMSDHMGKGIMKFFSHIPLFWYPFAAVLFVVLTTVLLVFLCGYNIRTPLFSLTRSGYLTQSIQDSYSVRQSHPTSAITSEEPRVPVDGGDNEGVFMKPYRPLGKHMTLRPSLPGFKNRRESEVSEDSSSSIEMLSARERPSFSYGSGSTSQKFHPSEGPSESRVSSVKDDNNSNVTLHDILPSKATSGLHRSHSVTF